MNIGENERGECVYIKSRRNIDYKNSYKSFPFISNNFGLAGVLPIEDVYHDKLFPYSEIAGNNQEINHPYSILYSREEFINILEMGNADVQNIIID